jgi:hypothetical protein
MTFIEKIYYFCYKKVGKELRKIMIGKTISHYTILDEIGSGGMGHFYVK